MRPIEFKTPLGARLKIMRDSVVAVGEAQPADGSPACWVYTGLTQHIVAGSIEAVTAALGNAAPPDPFPSMFPHFAVDAPMPAGTAEPKPSVEIEFMRLERARAELQTAKLKLQVAEVGRRGRRRTGCGER